MKHHDPRRPIGKCKGCCLNFKASCAGGFLPEERWNGRRCKHYGDAELLEQVLSRPEPTGARRARVARKGKAAAMATEPHYNGVLDPGKLAGRAKRHGR